MPWLRRLLVDPTSPGSFSSRSRGRRWQELVRRFPYLGEMRVLDLGGTTSYWRLSPVRPRSVTIVNRVVQDPPAEEWMELRVGDACAFDAGSEHYDLTVSNSLLEHVGGAMRRQQLAEVIRASAQNYWVQTPHRSFPLEPHWLFPFFQKLPFATRVFITQRWTVGHRHAADPIRAAELVREVELIGVGEMRACFPDAELWIERFAGFPKSIVAYRVRSPDPIRAEREQRGPR